MRVVKNFKWESENVFRYVNKEGFEKMVKVEGDSWVIRDSTYVPMKEMLKEG